MEIKEMVGADIARVTGEKGDEEMVFEARDGRRFVFRNDENQLNDVDVLIEDICGDLDDLVGTLVLAEEVSSEGAPELDAYSYTWTFYRFATAKGTVTVRWLGQSNGYYSESVDFRVEKPARAPADA